jgi:co-chaperonin GroES (HSP10)
MNDFIKDKKNQNAVRKSEIASVRYAINKGGVTITFKLKSGDEVYFFDYLESDAKNIIESL